MTTLSYYSGIELLESLYGEHILRQEGLLYGEEALLAFLTPFTEANIFLILEVAPLEAFPERVAILALCNQKLDSLPKSDRW